MNPSISLNDMICQAESGNSDAQFALGKMCFGCSDGIVSKDDEKAAYWFEQAVKNGDDDAIPPLFVLIATERVVGRSFDSVVKMLQQGAKRGNALCSASYANLSLRAFPGTNNLPEYGLSDLENRTVSNAAKITANKMMKVAQKADARVANLMLDNPESIRGASLLACSASGCCNTELNRKEYKKCGACKLTPYCRYFVYVAIHIG